MHEAALRGNADIDTHLHITQRQQMHYYQDLKFSNARLDIRHYLQFKRITMKFFIWCWVAVSRIVHASSAGSISCPAALLAQPQKKI